MWTSKRGPVASSSNVSVISIDIITYTTTNNNTTTIININDHNTTTIILSLGKCVWTSKRGPDFRAGCVWDKPGDDTEDTLTSEAVQGTPLPLQGIYHVHGGHCLPLGVLRVGDGVTDHILKEHLQNATSLLVDQPRDTLHASTTRKTTDGRLGDALDVVPEHLPVTLGASLPETLTALATSSHRCCSSSRNENFGPGFSLISGAPEPGCTHPF